MAKPSFPSDQERDRPQTSSLDAVGDVVPRGSTDRVETRRGLHLVNPITPTTQLLASIVPSAEPFEVFTSLVKLVVPSISQTCAFVLTEGGELTVRFENPPRSQTTLVESRSIEVSFAGPTAATPYRGSVIFGWNRRRPTEAERAVCELLVSHCVSLMAHERLVDSVRNLEIALSTNRRIGTAIGILMASTKVTEQQGFDALRSRSQHEHRKLREIADDVCETGWLQGYH